MKEYETLIINKNPKDSFIKFISDIFINYYNINITNRKLKKLKENIVNNILLIGDYEFNISKKNKYEYEVSYYKINKDKNIRLLFGCELETCILTRCSDKNLLIKLNEYKNAEDENLVIEYWVILVKKYIENILFSYTDEEFCKKFRYGCIIIHPKKDNIDYIIDFKKKSIYKNKDENIINKYKYLIFTRDSSLVCGDSLEKYDINIDKINKGKIKKDSFHCEIVSPKLEDKNDIIILYQGLFKTECFRGNESGAFHVNVSMLNSKNEPIYFSKGFLDCFLDLYENYENINYDKYRPYGSWYAKRIKEYSLGYTYKNIKSILDFKSSEETVNFNKNFLEGKKYYRSFIDFQDHYNAKYNSIHTKGRYIMEFRLFPTEDNKSILMNYVIDSIELLVKTNKNYSNNYSLIIDRLQNLNSEIEITYEPLTYYEGYVYYYDEFKNKFIDFKIFSDVFFVFEDILKNHNQRIIKYQKILDEEDYDEYIGQILDEKDNDIKNFNLKYFNKDGYIIFEVS
jgi:hypothetical protein